MYRKMKNIINYYQKKLTLGILVILPSMLTAQMKFVEHDIDVSGGGNVYDLILADIDNDSEMDIVTAHDHRVQWFKNDGSGNFTAATVSTSVNATRKVYAAFINNDSHLDIVSASQGDSKINWYENSGTDPVTWTTHQISNNALSARSVYAVDMNNDRNMDVLSASVNDGKIAWYEQNPGPPITWTEHQVALGSSADETIFAANLTSDNLVDIISGNSDLILFERGASGPTDFTTHILETGTTWLQSMTGIDFDGDSDIDIVSGNQYRRIYMGEHRISK